MINMMYLVLTALLALNVSKEILDAFVTVNEGLENTKATFKSKMDQQYSDFAGAFNENKQKVGPYYQSAQAIQGEASDILDHIDKIKTILISKTEKIPEDEVFANDTLLGMRYVKAKDDNNWTTNILVGTEASKPRTDENSATELKLMMIAYQETMSGIISKHGGNTALDAILDRTFSFEDRKDASGTNNNWESMNFYHVPLAAAVTILSKIQTDIRNTESDVVKWLYGQVDASSLKFTDIIPAIIPLTSYVTQGDSFKADVFLAAYDATNPPKIRLAVGDGTIDTLTGKINGDFIDVVIGPDGMGKLAIPASAVGQMSKGISIEYKPMGKDPMTFYKYANYEVAKPSLVVSPTKMNVFYKGVDNPVDVSVPGFSADKIKPSISNGSITRASGGGYIVKVTKGTTANISVTAELPDGGTKRLGPAEFRVKSVPNPTPYFAGKSVGDDKVKKAELTAAQGVVAKMLDFDFDLKFTVVQFKLTMIIGGTPIEKLTKSNRISGDMKEMLKKAKRGQKVYIEGIKAKGPDGTIRNLGSLSFKVI